MLKKQKQNANPVGAAISRPHLKETTLKNKEGITLIALIITIIVMLILVGVTINVALNGGLFKNAETAAKQMQIKADEEVLYAEVLAVYDAKTGTIDTEKLKTNLQAMGWTVNSNGNPFICTSPKGNTFEITVENGNIKIEYKEKGATGEGEDQTTNDFEITVEQAPNGSPVSSVTLTIGISNIENIFTEEEAFLATINYINDNFGANTVSSDEDVILFFYEMELEQSYEKYEDLIASNEELADKTTAEVFEYIANMTVQEVVVQNNIIPAMLKVNGVDVTEEALFNGNTVIYGVGKNGTYEIELELNRKTSTKTIEVNKIEQETYTNEEVLKALGITNYTGTYNGTWTKIGTDENGNAKLVSTSDVATYTLGQMDLRATDPTVEGSLKEGATELDIAIWSYKNAVNSLNEVVEEATKGIPGARSINVEDIETLAGIQDSDKGDEYNKPYTYNYTNHKGQTFVNENGETVKIDSEGKEVTLKHTYYYKELSRDDIGILASGYYWLASPYVDCNSYYAYFYVRCMGNGKIDGIDLFNSYGGTSSNSNGVRAVVSVSGL